MAATQISKDQTPIPLPAEAPGNPATSALDPVSDEGALPSGGLQGLDLQKIRDFDHDFQDDVFLDPQRWQVLTSAVERLARAQRLVGHGHFNILGFDHLRRYARNFPQVGEFTTAESELMDEIFHADARRYGFFGEKVMQGLTDVISEDRVRKVGNTGHYLLRGSSMQIYRKLRGDVGEGLVLTSGVRGMVKQIFLFLEKSVQTQGNLSRASRSLAPPGYSFHAVGDFDVGEVGLGADNFTEAFAESSTFQRMADLGYVSIRYPEDNRLGVRHEPWHIQV